MVGHSSDCRSLLSRTREGLPQTLPSDQHASWQRRGRGRRASVVVVGALGESAPRGCTHACIHGASGRWRWRSPPAAADTMALARRAYSVASDFVFGGTICALGDLAAQAIEGTSMAKLDARRTAAVASYGATVAAPYHFWYKFLAYQFPGTSARQVAGKTACELLIALPLFEIPAFTIWTGAFSKGESLRESMASLRTSWSEAVVTGWSIWGPASVATFGLVADPRNQLRIFYCSGAAWACAISYLSYRERSAESAARAA